MKSIFFLLQVIYVVSTIDNNRFLTKKNCVSMSQVETDMKKPEELTDIPLKNIIDNFNKIIQVILKDLVDNHKDKTAESIKKEADHIMKDMGSVKSIDSYKLTDKQSQELKKHQELLEKNVASLPVAYRRDNDDNISSALGAGTGPDANIKIGVRKVKKETDEILNAISTDENKKEKSSLVILASFYEDFSKIFKF